MNTRASSINRALDQIGDKWCLLIMQQIFLGINSFNEILEATGASRGVLSDRLKWLESADCLEKALSTGSRRYRYYLTDKSRDLYANALMALAWETSYGNSASIEATQLVHKNCGERCTPRMQCRACQQSIQADDVSYRPGPGATEDQRLKKVRRRSSISVIDAASSKTLYKNLIHIVGDRWTANIIALAYHGFNRFDQFNRELPVATNILSDRLKFLVEQDIFTLVAYQQKPPRYEYQLSPKGEGLYPWFLSLLQWGDKWCDPQQCGRPMRLQHKPCRKALVGEVICSACGEPLKAQEVSYQLAQ